MARHTERGLHYLLDWQVGNAGRRALHGGVRKLFRTALILEIKIVTFHRVLSLEIFRVCFVVFVVV